MKRRSFFGIVLAGVAEASCARAADETRRIQLHCDLAVEATREQEMLDAFETIFRPIAMKQPGFLDVKMLKLRSAIAGPEPAGGKYRFAITFESEELRQKWIASPAHQEAWPPIENTLTDKNFGILLYDIY